jgi:redox-sensing transcriptional repressor
MTLIQATDKPEAVFSLSTVRRLPCYVRILKELTESGREIVSSETIANRLNLLPIVVRKDLASVGIVGKPRIGYNVVYLLDAIEQRIGIHNTSTAILAGAGNLGSALLGSVSLRENGLDIVAAIDCNAGKIGTRIHGKPVYELTEATELIKTVNIRLGILCVPYQAAQQMADSLVEAGIRGIWNFTTRELSLPSHVIVQNEDLTAGLALLSVALMREEHCLRNTEQVKPT